VGATQKKALPEIPAGLDVISFQLRCYAQGMGND
jgi:hypothetical protein